MSILAQLQRTRFHEAEIQYPDTIRPQVTFQARVLPCLCCQHQQVVPWTATQTHYSLLTRRCKASSSSWMQTTFKTRTSCIDLHHLIQLLRLIACQANSPWLVQIKLDKVTMPLKMISLTYLSNGPNVESKIHSTLINAVEAIDLSKALKLYASSHRVTNSLRLQNYIVHVAMLLISPPARNLPA